MTSLPPKSRRWQPSAAAPAHPSPIDAAAPMEQFSASAQAHEFAVSWPLLGWWYRRTTPPPPQGRLATRRERERIRRARLASVILAVQLVLIELPVIPVVLTAPNRDVVLPWLLGCIVALLAAFLCNRRGWLIGAGLLMVGSIEITVGIKILTVPGGISLFYLPQFDILVQPILIAVALLAPWSAFAVAGCNILFVAVALTIGPHAPDLAQALHTPQAADLFAVPIMSQVLAAVFSVMLVRSLLTALRQLDQARQIAALHQQLRDAQLHQEAQTRQLVEGAMAFSTTIRQISAGQVSARVQVPQEHPLWEIAVQFNLLLERSARWRDADQQLEATRSAIEEWTNEITDAGRAKRPIRLPSLRNTPLDQLLIALSDASRSQGTDRRGTPPLHQP